MQLLPNCFIKYLFNRNIIWKNKFALQCFMSHLTWRIANWLAFASSFYRKIVFWSGSVLLVASISWTFSISSDTGPEVKHFMLIKYLQLFLWSEVIKGHAHCFWLTYVFDTEELSSDYHKINHNFENIQDYWLKTEICEFNDSQAIRAEWRSEDWYRLELGRGKSMLTLGNQQ